MSTALRILNVEANHKDALLTSRELQSAGYQPLCKRVATLEAFLAMLKPENWDIILAEYSLPKFNGLDALKAKHRLAPNVPFVFVSAEKDEEAIVSAMKAGANDYVLKRKLSRLGPVIDRELRNDSLPRALTPCEEQLQDGDVLFRSVIEKVSDLIIILNDEGMIRYCSPSVGRALGYLRNELIAKSGLNYLHPDQQPIAREALARRERSIQNFSLVACQIRHQDGTWRNFEGTVTNLLADPIVSGIVCNLRDVTQQRELQNQLSRAQRLESLGSLAGGIAHDLNNMLTPILLAADLLQGELAQADRKMILESLLTGANRAASTVHQLLSFAKGMRAEWEVAPVDELIRESAQLLRYGFPKSISIHTHLPKSIWPVRMGAAEFTQILMNLCVNARDAMPQGGHLNLSAENVTVEPNNAGMYPGVTPGRYVVFDVGDTGLGISPEVQKQIFDPFFTTKGSGGTGLGLPAACGILRGYDGFIRTYSEEGEGSRFVIYIPAVTTPEMANSEQISHTWPAGHGELVLVINDLGAIREILRATLEAHNYRVKTAVNGAVGLALYREHSAAVKLVIVDLASPSMDSQAIINAIRKLNPQARIILQSGFVSERNKSRIDAHSADVFLERPYATDELLHCVHDLLQRS